MTQTSLTNLATAQCLMLQKKESDLRIPKHNIRDVHKCSCRKRKRCDLSDHGIDCRNKIIKLQWGIVMGELQDQCVEIFRSRLS